MHLHALLLVACCGVSLAAQGNSLFISGNVMTGITWRAPKTAGNGSGGSCSLTAAPVQYYSAPFHTDQTASTYRLTLSYPSYQSGFVYLYQDGFDPKNPCAGLFAFGLAPVADIPNIHLDANRQYYFVTSEDVLYIGGGAFQVTIQGPVGSRMFRGSLAALTSRSSTISLSAGGSQPWNLDAGPARGNELYLVLGSVSGTSPGILLPGGLPLPLNSDPWLVTTLSLPNAPPLYASFGLLDAAGTSQAGGLALPAGSPPVLAGLRAHHAFVVLDPVLGTVTFVSNALPVQLVP